MASALVLAFAREAFGVEVSTTTEAVSAQVAASLPDLSPQVAEGVETNYWVRTPVFTKTAWREGGEPAAVTNGLPRYGRSEITYLDRVKGTVTNVLPTVAGEYTVRFTVEEGFAYEGLETAIAFSIVSTAEMENGDGYCSVLDFASRATYTVSGYKGVEGVVNFPVIIKIDQSADSPAGFRYRDLKNGADELRFFDSTGRSLPYETVAWNQGGESIFWVLMPVVKNGETITMCWNLRDGCWLPKRPDARNIWTDFVGVWHMDEPIMEDKAATTLSADASGHGLDAVPKAGATGDLSRMISVKGVFSRARVNDTVDAESAIGAGGNFLWIPNTSGRLDMGKKFTVSMWAKIDEYEANTWPQIFVRRQNSADTSGFQIHLGGDRARDSIAFRGEGAEPSPVIQAVDTEFRRISGFTHLAFVYDNTTVSLYANGKFKGSGEINAATDNHGPIGLGNRPDGTEQSLYGEYDEVRLSKGVRNADWIAAEYSLGTDPNFITAGPVTNDTTAVLQNRWDREPSISKITWEAGTHPTWGDFDLGHPGSGKVTVIFYDRVTGRELGEDIPTGEGEYRAVLTVAEQADESGTRWGALQRTLEFRIVKSGTSHCFGINVDRILLMNDDYSIAGGEVTAQGYDNEDEVPDYPYWRHLDDEGEDASSTYEDYWSVSYEFNLGGGTHHVYMYAGQRLWDLDGVRIGNTFNNGERLEEDAGVIEEDDEGLAANQNYLCWNSDSERVFGSSGGRTGPYHRYAGQIVMQNKLDAAVTSSCYSNGIGTVYFDAVNGWTDNVTGADGEANYRLVVEIATNLVGKKTAPIDGLVDSTYTETLYDEFGRKTGTVSRVYKAFAKADWKRVPMRVLRFDGSRYSDLGKQDELSMDLVGGGSCRRFYRVIVPVNVSVPSRFRIRRTAIDPEQSLMPDGTAYILMDNVICSKPTVYVNLEPYGYYDAKKTGKETLGWEGAFDPAFPCAADVKVMGRARATMSDGSPVPAGVVSVATMHYRWHYLNQKQTGWQLADMDPNTFLTQRPLELPLYQGDIDFWFELNQNGNYYTYADYSGTGLGVGKSGYSEEISSVTNRATAYATEGDWYVRMREGHSDLAEMKLLVKTSEDALPTEIDLHVTDRNVWCGYYRTTQALPAGIWWRIEPRNWQTSGATEWNTSTNYWYVRDWVETPPTFPAAGRLSGGGAQSWCRMPCDAQTDYLMFQVDETSLGVTVIHAAYQNFNSWNDAGKGLFTGSSTETNFMRGVSSDVRTYEETYAKWADALSTDERWTAIFEGTVGKYEYNPSYTTFPTNVFKQWELGMGMWVHEYYRDAASRAAFQMRGGGSGYMDFADKTQLGNEGWPRGIGSVSFKARIAQPVSPELCAYAEDCAKLTNYTFMARAGFDVKQNKGFSGDASLSLFAYYRPRYGAYEARWEQIKGKIQDNPEYAGTLLEPQPDGQRLVLVRWDPDGNTYKSTELAATTNYLLEAWRFEMPKMPFVTGGTETNNLLPFCISVYQTERNGPTYITAAVRVKAKSPAKFQNQPTGVTAAETIMSEDANWYFVTYRDDSAQRLTRGTYGVLSSGCEGVFARPQFRAQPTWPGTIPQPQDVTTKNNYSAQVAATANPRPAYVDCFDAIYYGEWSVNPGRQVVFGDPYDGKLLAGLSFAPVNQSVDIYTAKMTDSTKSKRPTTGWSYLTSIPVTGFGAPGEVPDFVDDVRLTGDVAVRLQTGGTPDDYRTDVTISDVVLTQWRGRDDWSTGDRDWDWNKDQRKNANEFGATNIVFTSGWATNGAVRLSARRTATDHACSIRSPLFDGIYQTGYGTRSLGLGMLGFTYRRPQENVRLLVQIMTNFSGTASLKDKSREVKEGDGDRSWHTVTTLNYATLMENFNAETGIGEWRSYFGMHGVCGMMRVVVDPELVKEVAGATSPDLFGEIDVTSFWCKDEPALDKGCWWGWNMQTLGNLYDTQRRMYLPDCTPDPEKLGQSLALNNSMTDDVNPTEDPQDFKKHLPFLQSPTFTNALIGQVTFKARKFELSDRSPAAKVVIYGAEVQKSQDELAKDSAWTFVTEFPITNMIYTTYTYKTDGEAFTALRLAVVIEGTEYPPEEARTVPDPQRVLIDEVTVSEAVRAMLAFRNVGGFRSHMDDNEYVENVPSKEEQPLCNENWGIQAEVFATMLGDEIDKSFPPKVKLHWYVGKTPWGYENWKGCETGSTYLEQAASSNYVYRSSYTEAPQAVMPAQSDPGTVVQYMLEVEYRTLDTSKAEPKSIPATNWLDAASWSAPDWYAPVDYNADPNYGAGRTFAAFNILDTVAPGWAWINEVNILGASSRTSKNPEEQFQYVEVCAPMEADLSGWRIRMLEAGIYDNRVVTNDIARFGNGGIPGMKTDFMGAASNKVFRCIGNKVSADLRYSNGTLDGLWSFSTNTSMFSWKDGYYYVKETEIPFGVQLVRPSGVIESSIVIVGTNKWDYHEYAPETVVEKLNANVPGSRFFYASDDGCGAFRSASVTASHGESKDVWAHDWACSPGYINTNVGGTVVQQIDPKHPTPHGDTIVIYASVDTQFGHIRQRIGSGAFLQTNSTELIMLPRGSKTGTNIVYTVEPWYELAYVKTNDVDLWSYRPSVLEYTATIGVGASNNITVAAAASVDSKLRRYGLTEDNPYTPAVMDWLVHGTDAYGNGFAYPGNIALADYMGMSGEVVTNMTLTQMYWLDMDPTVSNLVFKAGMVKTWPETENAEGHPVSGYLGQNVLTNQKMRVFMMISNRVDGTAWSPYILRGLDPNYTSWDYRDQGPVAHTWTSETFKVTGILANGLTSELNKSHWLPLRWFVFQEGSFFQPDNPEGHEPFTTDIEIVDPHSSDSPGANAGWYQWCKDHGWVPVFNCWSIDTRLQQGGVEVLRPENFLAP